MTLLQEVDFVLAPNLIHATILYKLCSLFSIMNKNVLFVNSNMMHKNYAANSTHNQMTSIGLEYKMFSIVQV